MADSTYDPKIGDFVHATRKAVSKARTVESYNTVIGPVISECGSGVCVICNPKTDNMATFNLSHSDWNFRKLDILTEMGAA